MIPDEIRKTLREAIVMLNAHASKHPLRDESTRKRCSDAYDWLENQPSIEGKRGPGGSPLGYNELELLRTAYEVINLGVGLMPRAQLGRWEGVRLAMEEIGAYLEQPTRME